MDVSAKSSRKNVTFMLALLANVCSCVNCSSVFKWQYWCEEGDLTDWKWCQNHCSPRNSWDQVCEVYDGVECEGNRTFTRKQWCPNHNGVHYGMAVLLAYVSGMFGIDRFYLGYYSVGLIKLFTFGFFYVGYIFDCILITLQLVGPADGTRYAATRPFPFLMRAPHHDIV